ncbi:MAG: hypothetical protein GEV03_25150 [Streptosporangiales bacterium]|nr:hypothetical protein [Streptosporangiales bacterium]
MTSNTEETEETEETAIRGAGPRRSRRSAADQPLDFRPLVLIGLVILTAVPVAVLVVPNTISLAAAAAVRSLGVQPESASQVVRVYGLALPALMLTVPAAAVHARRTRPWPVLLTGLVVLGATELLAGMVGSVFLLAVLRIFQGIGAGMVLPATLVLVTALQRRGQRLLSAWYAGVLVVSLMAVTPMLYLALLGDEWDDIMQPYPLLVAAALVCTALLIIAERPEGLPRAGTRESERILLLPVIPALGLSVFAFGASFNWATWALLALAVTALIVMYGLTTLGDAFDGRAGVNHAVVSVSAGVVVLPVTAQIVNISLPGFGGPGLGQVWAPLAVAVLVTLAAAVAGNLGRPDSASKLVIAGLVAAGLGLLAVRLFMPASNWLVILSMALLGGGIGCAFGASLRGISSGAGLLGLGLIFPAVLAGQLLSGAFMLRVTESIAQGTLQPQYVHGVLLSALRSWVTVSALVLLVAIVDVSLASMRREGRRRRPRAAGSAAERTEATGRTATERAEATEHLERTETTEPTEGDEASEADIR